MQESSWSKRQVYWTFQVIILLLFLRSNLAQAEQDLAIPEREALEFFEREVRPVLVEHCYRCHGQARQRSDLRLDSKSAVLQGGIQGPAVVPAHPEESLLVEAIRYEGLEMPPEGPLPEEKVNLLVRWVELGAPWTPEDQAEQRDLGFSLFTDADRAEYAYQPLGPVAPPRVQDQRWLSNPIDQFILDRLEREGLTPAPRADRRTLVRRLYFDLTGLPPSPDQVQTFLNDSDPQAYRKLVDRLLDSPRFGERWGRHWLDLVRFAESNGYRADEFRPFAWRYRDYVIQSLNDDLPYDQFIKEQIAGDELSPDDPRAKVATGYLRLWVYESNQRDVEAQWDAILDDLTDVTSDVFLGLGMGCARCHDHKYDPILQRDYYRLRSHFAAILPREDLSVLQQGPGTGRAEREAVWNFLTLELRSELKSLEEDVTRSVTLDAISKFQPEMRSMIKTPPAERTLREHQLAELAYRQVTLAESNALSRLKGEDKERRGTLLADLDKFDFLKPPGPSLDAIVDVSAEAPPTRIPGKRSEEEILPGPLSILDPEPSEIRPVNWSESTGRRSALAHWLTDPAENPLPPRVIVNRLWQHHFGEGIVETPSDFGRLGEPPTYPELLDWLANELIQHGWSLKHLHRLMVTSSTYQQASDHPLTEHDEKLLENQERLFGKMRIRRLEAEPIRDAMLAVSGELDRDHIGGPSVDPDQPVRSIFTKFKRNAKDPFLSAFDVAGGYLSTSRRNVTTTPIQSLLMINGAWTIQRARAFSDRLLNGDLQSDRERVDLAFQMAFGRPASPTEIADTLQFLRELSVDAAGDIALNEPGPGLSGCDFEPHPITDDAWVDFCHALFNSSEFIYID